MSIGPGQQAHEFEQRRPCRNFETTVIERGVVLFDAQHRIVSYGKALADEVRRRWPGTRLVFMSGYSENILSTEGRLESAVLLLNKPFRKHELARMLRRALDAPQDPSGR